MYSKNRHADADNPMSGRNAAAGTAGLTDRIPIIDLVRLGSILLVLGCHYDLSLLFTGSGPRLNYWLHFLFYNGLYGVTCFFVVSGYVITSILVDRQQNFGSLDLKSFYIKRVARIFPLLILIVTAGYLIVKTVLVSSPQFKFCFFGPSFKFGWALWASIFTFTFNWYFIAQNFFISSIHWLVLWSLSVEEQFYLFYPLIAKRLKSPQKLVVFLWIMVAAGFLFRLGVFYTASAHILLIQISSFSSFDQIAIGALIYFYSPVFEKELRNREGIRLFFMACGAGMLLILLFKTDQNNNSQWVFTPTLVAGACALMILAGRYSKTMQSAFWQVLSLPGKLSYGGYLWHATVLYFAWPLLAWVSPKFSLEFFLGLTWAWCYISYRWFEIPMNHFVRGLFGVPRARNH